MDPMVAMTALWLPVLISAVLVFLASSILHMVLPLHRKDYDKLPDEGILLEAMRKANVQPGNYYFPRPADPKDMKSPEMVEKYTQGPVGMMNILPSGPPAMGGFLAKWFIYCIVIAIFVAYLCSRTVAAGAEYMTVFRAAGTVAFLGFGGGHAQESIWKGQRWGTTLRHLVDSLVYALLTAGAFAWLWPAA